MRKVNMSEVGNCLFCINKESPLHYHKRCTTRCRFLRVKSERDFSKNVKIVNDFAYDVIRSRQKLLKENPAALNADILSLFIKRAQKDGETLSDKFLRDVVRVFASYDTRTYFPVIVQCSGFCAQCLFQPDAAGLLKSWCMIFNEVKLQTVLMTWLKACYWHNDMSDVAALLPTYMADPRRT